MKDNYFIGIYWGVRKKTIDECANKVEETFDFLYRIDSSFAEWYKTTRPRRGELVNPLEIRSIAGIEKILLEGRNYNDLGEGLDDLGYSIYIKSNTDFSKAHVLSIRCGCYNEFASNCVALNIGRAGVYNHLRNMLFVKKIYKELVEIWRPDSGVIRCDDVDVFLEKFT